MKWKTKLAGEGSATPIIWDNLVFVQSAVRVADKPEAKAPVTAQFAGLQAPPRGEPLPGATRGGGRPRGFGGGGPPKEPYRFTLTALDRVSGKVAWQKTLREEVPHEGHHPTEGSFASASPVADGQGVFAYFGSRGLYALDHQGNIRWQKDLGKMQVKMTFGEGSSPALFGDYLVVNWDHEGQDFIVAFDKTTGRQLWRVPRNEATSWSTPLIFADGGRTQVVVNASAKVRSYDLTVGKELWSAGPLTANAIPSAVAGNGMVYCMSGFRGAALFAIRPEANGEATGSEAVAWTYHKDTPYVPSPLLYGDQLYFLKGNDAMLTVLNAKTGDVVLGAQRLEGLRGVYASPLGAAGRVYLVGRDGGVLVLKKSSQLEILATNRLDDRFDASPGAAGKDLFLRGKEYLYCLSESQ